MRIELFDGLRVVTESATITRFRTHKTAAVLGYLAYSLPRLHPREVLLEMFWPDAGETAARHNLSNALSALRAQLEPPGVAPGSVLVTDRAMVGLTRVVTTDVRQFQEHLDHARQAAGTDERVTALAAAVQLYRGELLRGQYEDWIFPEQARLAAQFVRSLQELISYFSTVGELDPAIGYATQAVSLDPLDEGARHQLIALYDAAGQRDRALAHYHEFERLLRRELDARPGPEIRSLAQRLSASTSLPAFPADRPAGSGLAAAGSSPETVGGAMAPDSPFYVSRPTDTELHRALEERVSIVLVKGPRQTGKTSLLARGLQRERERGAHVVLTDFQTFTAAELASVDGVLFALAEALADGLDLEERPRPFWDADRGPALNLRRYLRRQVLPHCRGPLVWALDEADRLFPFPSGSQVFGMFRSWHNERALDPSGPWSQLTLVLAYSTEAHLFISDLSQSPFNVGTRLELGDFAPEQVADLNQRHGAPLSEAELPEFAALVGGHPYLVRRGLSEMVRRGAGLRVLTSEPNPETGLFGEHLKRLVLSVTQDCELAEAVRAVLKGRRCPSEESFYRLRSGGVLAGSGPDAARLRCGLYQQVLARRLG